MGVKKEGGNRGKIKPLLDCDFTKTPQSIEGARKSFRMGFQVLSITPPALPDPGVSCAVKHSSWSLWVVC